MSEFFAKIGPFVLWYAATLVAVAFVVGLLLYLEYRRTRGLLAEFRAFLEEVGKKLPQTSTRGGLSKNSLDTIEKEAIEQGDHVKLWWQKLNESLVHYERSPGIVTSYLSRPTSAIFDYETLIEATFNQRLARALPGLVTSAGLLGTFIAILLGLLELKVLPDQRIDGIGTLIENLSGKFLTSIVAIGLSIVISLIELGWFRSLRESERYLLKAIERLIQPLDHTLILRDIQEDSRKQTVSLSNISSEVVDRFQSVFTEALLPAFAENMRGELAPTLEKISTSMDRVGELLGTIQSEKQESVVGEFRTLASGLESTLKSTMEQIGRDFRESLSGSTTGEFDKASSALGASAEVLRGLNDSFSQMRDSLEAVVAEARRATAEQMENGSERAKSLNDLVEQLLVRLSESATDSASQVQLLLAQSVEGMQRQMQELSSQMTAAVTDATSTAAAASREVMQAADASSRQAQEDANLLSAKLAATLERMEGIGDTLGAAQISVRQAINDSTGALQAFERAGAELRTSAATLAGTATTAKEVQDGMKTTIGRMTESVAQLHGVAVKQQDTLERQLKAFAEVERVFDGLDAHLGSVLGTITDRLQQHNQAIQQNFEAILSRVNTEVPKVSTSLLTVTEELSGQVEDLADVIERLRQQSRPGQ